MSDLPDPWNVDMFRSSYSQFSQFSDYLKLSPHCSQWPLRRPLEEIVKTPVAFGAYGNRNHLKTLAEHM
jgi:hypothetical protein